MSEHQPAHAQPIPQSLAHLIQLNVEYNVLICMGNGCRCAVSPATISSHLRRNHHVTIELRRQVDRYIVDFPVQYDHSDVQLPHDGLAPQPIIKVVTGFECQHCQDKPFRSQNRKAIKEHGNKIHKKQRVADEDLLNIVQLQSWFWKGKERYWIVDESNQDRPDNQPDPSSIHQQLENDNTESDNSDNHDNDSQDTIDDPIERDIKEWKVEAKERRLTLLSRPPADEADPWFRYTQWTEVLSQSKHNKIKTHQFTREPDPEEPGLERVLQAWDRILTRCLATMAASDHRDTLKWWASPKNEVASQRPFELPQNTKTIQKYSGIYQHFLCYVMRTMPITWSDESETGVVYTEDQWRMIDRVRTILQTNPPEDEYTDPSEQDQELTIAIMRFCMYVVMQDTSRITVYESPLMHFLAVMGVDAQTNTFRRSFYYTPILAGVLYINRLILLEVAVPVESWPMLKSRDEISSVPERIMTIRTKHLCEGSFSPTSSILSQLAMGKSFNKLHKSTPNIHWSEDEQTIHYNGPGIELEKIRVMCQILKKELWTMLHGLMFGPMPEIDLSKIVDSMAWSNEFRRDDYSFIQHPKNQGIVEAGYKVLLRRARKATGDEQMIKKGDHGQDEWMDHRVNAYLKQEKKFLQKAMATVHIEYGQPARGPELGSIKVSNSVYSARNIYIINGRLCMLSTYDKARKRRGNIEYILRFFPDELSQIMVQYLVRVRSFARILDRRESEYLFADTRGPWAGEQLTQVLGPITEKHLGVRLTTSAYRQVAVGICTRHLIRTSKTWEKDEEAVEDNDNFADGDDDEELEAATFQHIMVRQAGHGMPVARDHYAIDAAFLHRLGPELISVYERASIAWHELFHLKSNGSPKPESKRIRHRREASQQIISGVGKKAKITIKPEQNIAHKKAMEGLRLIFGPTAQPQSEGQAAALELVHNPPRTSIIVLPTSSGKSVLFLTVAAMVQQQTVIVVVPYAALVDDIIDRGRQAGLNCEEWLDQSSGGEMQQLVVVSADRAVGEGFGHYAKGLEINRQLAHMFFDEAHVAFTDTSYRERLRELWKLRYMDCPFTCLTATLMPELEEVLRDRLLIPSAKLFRRSTARRTIRYGVRDCRDEAPSVFGIRLVQKLVLPSHKRGVVYVRSYQAGEVVSSALKCPFYRARAEQKGEVLQAWIQGPGGWIVATGALGTGINISDIVYVVHIDRPYGLTSFAQQSGRGGRNGEVSDSIIIVRAKTTSGRRRSEILSAYCVEDIDERAMTEFIQYSGCRRQVMAKYFDCESESTRVDCIATDSIMCDRCKFNSFGQGRQVINQSVEADRTENDTPIEISGSQLIAGKLRQGIEADELMFRVMDEFQHGCIFCRLVREDGEGLDGPHSYQSCVAAFQHQCHYGEFQDWREGITIESDYTHCFDCGLPQRLCRRFENGSMCEYPDIVFPGIFILHQRGYLEDIVQQVGFQGDYQHDLWEWMRGDADKFGAIVESCFIQTWRKICVQYRRMRDEMA